MKALYAALDDHIKQYENGSITISDDIEFSMRKTVKQITHYILSRYLEGGTDNKDPLTGKRRPFRNIGNAIVDIEWRAKNIDRKSIEGRATDGDHLFSLLVNKELQQWMKDNNFGKTIDDYQRKKSEYGSVLLKRTETDEGLLIEPVKWEHTYVDPRDIENGIKLEKNFLSILQLKSKSDVWTEQHEDGVSGIDAALAAHRKQKVKDENRIEVWDIEGEFEACAFDESPDENADETVGLYNIIVAVVGQKKFCLYKKKLKESRFKYDRRKEVEGRDMGVGVWEECFEPQIWTNEAVISEKDVMDVAGKVLIKTNKKNLPSAMSMVNGEMIDLEADEFFDAVQLTPQSLPQFQGIIDSWFVNTQRDQSTFPGITGEEPKASTPGISLELQAAQGGSIFNKRRDQDGFFLLDVILDWVLPYCVKQIDKDHTLTASYSPRELKMLDDAIRSYLTTSAVKEDVLSDRLVSTAMQEAYDQEFQGMLDKQGDQRTLDVPKGFITLAKIKKKIRFDITDEMMDDQRRLNALATTLSQLDPADPQRIGIIEEMMEISGVSAATFPVGAAAPASNVAPKPQASNRVQDVLPEGQQV